ncbi:MAG: hypothetical protein EOS78_24170 [Mesorhizobium sp.]|nr:hypothetical protein EJ077_02595 [Mesorhizobium sp. M8A.F.Ca.ET.057.01.1.1]RWE32494.1 MAG: hypothetical protein EOS78_24170 [Mesorhizobium sp.]RWE43810.1 MAG: hypothetical protein EOS80_21435 [Mesorhizobium sp.]
MAEGRTPDATLAGFVARKRRRVGTWPCLCRDGASRAVQRLIESPTRSNSLFSRNSGRKTVTHFSWNCSKGRVPARAPPPW